MAESQVPTCHILLAPGAHSEGRKLALVAFPCFTHSYLLTAVFSINTVTPFEGIISSALQGKSDTAMKTESARRTSQVNPSSLPAKEKAWAFLLP